MTTHEPSAKAFDASRTTLFRFDLWDMCEGKLPHPRDFVNQSIPGLVRKKWVAQTVCDAVWVYFEFDTAQAREAFEASRLFPWGKIFKQDQAEISHWTGP